MNKKNILFRALCLILSFAFILNQVAFAADTFSYQYKYSLSKSLLPDNSQKDQNTMAPAYLVNAQVQHEAVINQKNLVETQANYLIQNQKAQQDATIVLQKKQSSMGSPKKQLAYALTDYDSNGKPQQMYVYTYTPAGALSQVVSYDLRDFDSIPWLSAKLEKVSKDGQDLMMGSFTVGDYTQLTDSLKVKTVCYTGSIGNEKVDYILSDYINGIAESVSLYQYDASLALTEVDTYNISALKIDFDTTSAETWKSDVEKDSPLTAKAAYEGLAGAEKEVYALSEYDAAGAAGRIDCYDYNPDDSISQTRAYNIKGLDLTDGFAGLRSDSAASDQYLISKTNYKGTKDLETVDSVLSSYYLDISDNTYKPEDQTNYIYDSDGHLDRTETYYIKDGAYVLRQCSEFAGLKGYETIALSYDYDLDGVTIDSVSVYIYDLAININDTAISGDANKHTLDEVIRYVGTSDPHDLTGAKIESETFYSGTEGKEIRTYSFEFDIATNNIISRTDYKYNSGALVETDIYRLLDPDIAFNVTGGTLVSSTAYTGLKSQEKASGSTTFDLSGDVLTTSSYQYNADGSLGLVTTSDHNGNKTSATAYSGSENQEKITAVANFDLTGNITTTAYYTYGSADNLDRTDTFNSDGIKMSESTLR